MQRVEGLESMRCKIIMRWQHSWQSLLGKLPSLIADPNLAMKCVDCVVHLVMELTCAHRMCMSQSRSIIWMTIRLGSVLILMQTPITLGGEVIQTSLGEIIRLLFRTPCPTQWAIMYGLLTSVESQPWRRHWTRLSSSVWIIMKDTIRGWTHWKRLWKGLRYKWAR